MSGRDPNAFNASNFYSIKMENKDLIIASLRRELQETHSKCSALEQENALLENEVERLNRKLCEKQKPFDLIKNTPEN